MIHTPASRMYALVQDFRGVTRTALIDDIPTPAQKEAHMSTIPPAQQGQHAALVQLVTRALTTGHPDDLRSAAAAALTWAWGDRRPGRTPLENRPLTGSLARELEARVRLLDTCDPLQRPSILHMIAAACQALAAEAEDAGRLEAA